MPSLLRQPVSGQPSDTPWLDNPLPPQEQKPPQPQEQKPPQPSLLRQLGSYLVNDSIPAKAVKSAWSGVTAPGDAWAGKIAPEDMNQRAWDMAGLATGGSAFAPAEEGNVLRMGAPGPTRDALAQIKAYHGSPHDFDQFSLGKIGTGEGAQAYGHGLYFADNEAVAKGYRDMLQSTTFSHPKYGENLDFDRVENGLKAAMYGGSTLNDTRTMDKIATNITEAMRTGDDLDHFAKWVQQSDYPADEKDAWIAALGRAKEYTTHPGGHMYEVNINADPNHMLDWDKPLGEQSEVQQRIRDMMEIQQVPMTNNVGQPTTGSQLVDFLERRGGKEFATQELQDAGIPGIKYLDAGSRRAGEGSRNYVVFDDKLVSIVKKYGIAGAVAMGALTAEQARQFQNQQQGNQDWLQKGGT